MIFELARGRKFSGEQYRPQQNVYVSELSV